MKSKTRESIVFFIFMAVTAFVTTGTSGCPEGNETPLIVIDTVPAANSTAIAINADIRIVFNQEISNAALTQEKIITLSEQTQQGPVAVKGKVINQGKTLLFNPDKDLEYETEYELEIKKILFSHGGRYLEEDYILTFVTGKFEDKTPPEILSITPTSGSDGLDLNLTITVKLSEPIDPASLPSGMSLMDRSTNKKVETIIEVVGNDLFVRPAASLKEYNNYYIFLGWNLTDLAGNHLAEVMTSFFRTGIFQPVSPGITAVAAKNNHTCAVKDGKLHCWGANNEGQLGTADEINSPWVIEVINLSEHVTAPATGFDSTCAIDFGKPKCWGTNRIGQTGNGELDPFYNEPVAIPYFPQGSVTSFAAGKLHTCAIVAAEVKCWGANVSGQIGNGDLQYMPSGNPVAVIGLTNVTALAAGENFSCAVADGAAYCWGQNNRGQLGLSTTQTTKSVFPLIVPGFESGVTMVAAGHEHACAVKEGSLYCWGNNYWGNVGVQPTMAPKLPTAVVGLPAGSIAALALGKDHSCAVINTQVYCWGRDNYGQLGSAVYGGLEWALPSNPIALVGSGVVGISAGANHTCAIRRNGATDQLMCWGNDEYGQCGLGHPPTQTVIPTVVFDL